MNRRVRITPQAYLDLEEIQAYLGAKEGPDAASRTLDGIEKSVLRLSRLAQRGHFPPELEGLGLSDIREIHFKPYRIVYQVLEKTVNVLVVADGRMDFQTLLSRRLVR